MKKSDIQIFKSDAFGEIRTCQVEDQVMFMGSDVAAALGYTDHQKAIKMHVDADDKLTRQIVVSGQSRNVILINESGLYSLILSSRLPQARAFKRWVTAEVLPAIRRKGRYDMLPAEVRLLAGQAEYCQQVLQSIDCITTTQLAKEMALTCHDLLCWLMALGVLYWQSGEYMLYADYARMGLTKTRTHVRRNRLGICHTTRSLVWTEEGRKFIHEILKR